MSQTNGASHRCDMRIQLPVAAVTERMKAIHYASLQARRLKNNLVYEDLVAYDIREQWKRSWSLKRFQPHIHWLTQTMGHQNKVARREKLDNMDEHLDEVVEEDKDDVYVVEEDQTEPQEQR